GTAGMQPQLAVGYSSQSGNGMLGMGWNLQGLSMITRTGTTLYHDGYIDGVDFDNNDAYAWNGQRLLLMENLANGDVRYATEAESYTRIIAHGTSGNGPLKWTVITKDGTEMQYGYTEDARHQEQNSASVVRWMMNKVTDRRGNYMKYHYLEDNHTGTWRPDYIEYTGNAKANPDLIPYNKVKFYYGIRSDSTLAFVGGTQIKNNLLLRKIRTFAEGDFAREYRFTYFKDEFASFLNEITETSFTGERLNSTVVGWGEKSVDSLQAHETEIPYYICPDPLDCSHELTQMVRGDYNGDGVDDVFLVYKPLTSYTWLFKWYDFKNETLHHYETLNVYEMGCLGISFQSADFNGDGYDDLLRSWKQDESPDWEGVDIFINNKSGGDYAFTWLENAGNDSIPSVSLDDSPRFYAIDLDGDGQSEIIRFFKDRSGTGNYIAQVYEVTELGSPFQATLVASKSFDNTNLFSPFEFIDFNGNGTQELIHVKNISPEEQFFSYELNNETMQLEKIFSSGYPSEWHKRFYGDFNGDGNTDILTYHEDHGWELGYSTGKTFIIQDFCPIDDDFDPELNYNDTYTMDINGDGFCDIVTTCPSANNDLFIIHYSHGSSFTTDTVFLPHNLIELYDNITYHGDFNGDGTQEFLFAPWNIYDNFFLRLQIETPENADKVVAITNGLNQKLKIEYQKLLVDNDFYSRDNTNLADVREIAGPIAAVKKTEFDLGDANHNFYSTYYNYISLKMHLRGKGMLGMTTFTTHNT
ncbi:MAG: hypothetical protein EOM83_17095, partial [Clostridia bacterium]|nr:hypothetical protein [Clostridia bacterium]